MLMKRSKITPFLFDNNIYLIYNNYSRNRKCVMKKKVLLIIGIIVFIALLVTGGYLYLFSFISELLIKLIL